VSGRDRRGKPRTEALFPRRSPELQASSDLTRRAWHRSNWAACQRRGRSLHRRLVQAVQAGAWRKVKRLSSLWVHSLAARAVAVKRVTEHTGKKTPGVDGELWATPEKKAHAVERIGRWQRYRPVPLKRLSIPKKKGPRRPLSIPAMVDRARQALSRHALQPIAETMADPNSSGFRPQRRCAAALDPCFNVLRQHASATWLLEGEIQGFFDNRAFSWREAHIPMHKRVLSTGLRSGCIDHGALSPTTAGVPQGGLISPVVSNWVVDGLEAVVHGRTWHRRRHHIKDIRWADDCIVTANARQVLEETILPRITAFLADRGVRLSTEKTVMTPITDGFAFVGQTLRQHERLNGKPATLQRTPSKGSCQGSKTQGQARCQHAVGATPARRSESLNPVLRGWANYPRHVICPETCAKLDRCVWQRLYRWAQHRHPEQTGRWITPRDFPHQRGESWRFTDPTSGKQLIRGQEVGKPQRHIKIKGDANPFDPQGEAYCQHRDRQLALRTTSACRAQLLNQPQGLGPNCRQVIHSEENLE
jgi:RNA-directed DNA polymerase